MNKKSGASKVTRQDVSLAIAGLMPFILRGMQLDFFVRHGVTQTQFLVLSAVRADGRCTMGGLARNLHVSMPTASGIIDRLVRAGYIRRTAHPQDRRQVLVALTPNAQAFFRDFESVIRRRWEEVLAPLEPNELKAFYDVTTKLRVQLQRTIA